MFGWLLMLKKVRRKQISIRLFLILLLLTVNNINAGELLLGLGGTGEGQTTQRISYIQPWDKRWFESSVGSLTGGWDVGYTKWQKGRYGNTAHSFSISPVFIYQFNTNKGFQPFIEVGIGAAFFNRTRVGDSRLGSSFNFEDRIGVGIKSGRHRFGLRAMHYSNLGLKRPNQGVESYSLYYSYQF